MLKTTRLFARKLAFRCAALMSAGVRQVALGDYRARIRLLAKMLGAEYLEL